MADLLDGMNSDRQGDDFEEEDLYEMDQSEADERAGGRGGGSESRHHGYHRALSCDNAERMSLSQHERNLAITIKEAIAAAPDIDLVSDFMCAQLALIDGDNIEAALERVYHLQCFREEYGIHDTATDGRKCFADYIELFPTFHLCFTFDSGNYIMMFDNTKFDANKVKTEENIRTWLGGTYYTCAIFCPDFEAIRSGAVVVLENEGYAWKRDMRLLEGIKRVWSEVASVYPMSFQKMKYFNSGTAMNVLVSMLKPFLPKHLQKNVEVGCQFEQRLDSLYLVPTVEEANERLLARVEETLQKRYYNERAFEL
ncbi:expressed unknown protein [Seminavis robusta]|uniref:CRAL-TRIO domain-containing protein n=1 Tax=Seminavis robusta TaxID=568900 RepID=A0A9N8DM78_9STRA|nr:expressed unknown protein [Seminavis robusta]|eukprot:Sro156_g070880.1 n/a (312) ;mRNA; r:68139-69164